LRRERRLLRDADGAVLLAPDGRPAVRPAPDGQCQPMGGGGLAMDDRAPGRVVAPSDPLRGDRAVNGILSVRREIGDQSSLGILGTSRDFGSGSNRVFSLDSPRSAATSSWISRATPRWRSVATPCSSGSKEPGSANTRRP